jgi:signal peptidase I
MSADEQTDRQPETAPPSTSGGPQLPYAGNSGFTNHAGAPHGNRSSQRVLARWVRDIAISLAVSAFFIIFLYQPVRVEGTSMMPTLEDQERVFVNKFVYRFEHIERGDVIVFRYPLDTSKSYIKRVIARPGDRIRIDDGLVYVNGHQIAEVYVPSMYEDVRSYREIVVPQHSYFVMGDHRNLSRDSRDFGPVDESYIYGKAVFGYWPMARVGKLR